MVKKAENGPYKFKSALPYLFLIATIYMLFFMSRMIFSPLLIAIQSEMGFSHSQAGKLFLYISIGAASGLISNGFISKKLLHKQIVVLTAFMSGSATLLSGLAPNYTILSLSLIFLGWATGVYFPSGFASITSLVESENWGKSLSVHDLAPNLAFIFAPLFAEVILSFTSWRVTLYILSFFMALLGLFYLKKGKGGFSHGEALKPKVILFIIKQPVFWIFLFFFSTAIGTSIGLYAMLPIYLITDHGFEREVANHLLSVSRISGLFVTLIAGYIIDKIGAKTTLKLYFTIAGITTVFIGIAPKSIIIPVVLIQPVILTAFFPAGFTALSHAFDEQYRSVAVSLITSIANVVGIGLVPTMLGYLAENGKFNLGFIIVGLVIFSCLLLLPKLKFHNNNNNGKK